MGVEIPAVVIEARLSSESFDFSASFFLDMQKAHDHIGDLNAGVIDIVLDIDCPARVSQQANKSIAENGIAKMAYVRRLVGINAGVFHQNFPFCHPFGRLLVGGQSGSHQSAVDFHIQVARRRDLHLGDALNRANLIADRFGNLHRRGAKRLGERKNWNSEVAEFHPRGWFDSYIWQVCSGITVEEELHETVALVAVKVAIPSFPSEIIERYRF